MEGNLLLERDMHDRRQNRLLKTSTQGRPPTPLLEATSSRAAEDAQETPSSPCTPQDVSPLQNSSRFHVASMPNKNPEANRMASLLCEDLENGSKLIPELHKRLCASLSLTPSHNTCSPHTSWSNGAAFIGAIVLSLLLGMCCSMQRGASIQSCR